MFILGIETSCDETAAAVVENGTKIVSHVKATSVAPNIKFGGVVPDKTAREQLKFILPVIHEALQSAFPGLSVSEATKLPFDAIAVTSGPGLIGSLLIGVETAKTLALAWNKPLIPINHLVGHIYANWLTASDTAIGFSLPEIPPQFPALVLLVSGGHSELILMSGHGQYKLLGSTRDDAAGECFDKCGRILGLPYPYGPYIEKEADKHLADSSSVIARLPRPLINHNSLDFSFSGLKTAFLNEYKKLTAMNDQSKSLTPALAYELQEAVTDVLVVKLFKAAELIKPKSIIICGGVAANKRLREKAKLKIENYKIKINLHIPPISLCTDNATYIAAAAYFNNHPLPIEKITALPGLSVSEAF